MVASFQEHDRSIPLRSTPGGTSLCEPFGGLLIAFVDQPMPGGGGNALAWNTLQVQDNTTFINGPFPTGAGVLLFGHEISHYAQGIHRITVQGEVLARYAEQQLRHDLSPSFGQVAWSREHTDFLTSLSPFYGWHLQIAKDYLFHEEDRGYIIVPLRWGFTVSDPIGLRSSPFMFGLLRPFNQPPYPPRKHLGPMKRPNLPSERLATTALITVRQEDGAK